MSSTTDFLFNGSPPPSVNSYGTSTQNIPQWMSDYTQGLLAKANSVAAQPYQPYTGPRVAGFTPDQQSSFDYIRGDIGAYQPTLNAAINYTSQVGNSNPLNTAAPYLNQSAQSSAGIVGNYMNPYTDSVVNRLGELGARNLSENLLPAIGDNFTRAGQYGSSRMQEMVGRAMRDTQESTLAAQNNALQQGYGQALGAAQTDLNRYGQLGQTAGNLENAGNQNLINAASTQANIGNEGQRMYLTDAAALQDVGAQNQALTQRNLDTAYGDFVDQRNYPMQQVGFLNNMIRGVPYSQTTNQTVNAPSNNYAPSGLNSLVSGLGILSKLGG